MLFLTIAVYKLVILLIHSAPVRCLTFSWDSVIACICQCIYVITCCVDVLNLSRVALWSLHTLTLPIYSSFTCTKASYLWPTSFFKMFHLCLNSANIQLLCQLKMKDAKFKMFCWILQLLRYIFQMFFLRVILIEQNIFSQFCAFPATVNISGHRMIIVLYS